MTQDQGATSGDDLIPPARVKAKPRSL